MHAALLTVVVAGLAGLAATLGISAQRETPAVPVSTSTRAALHVTSFEVREHTLVVTAGRAQLTFTAVSDHVLRMRGTPNGALPSDFSWAVVDGAATPVGALDVVDEGAVLVARTKAMQLRIEKHPLRITVLDADGRALAEDDPRFPLALDAEGFALHHRMHEGEHFFGLGDKAGPLDRRHRAFTNWNTDAYAWQESTDPLYKTIPFFIGLREGKSYGIFVDNTWRTSFDFGVRTRDVRSIAAEGGKLDAYFIAGPAPRDVVERFTALTGRTPLPPLWSLGFQQSRYSYVPQERVLEVARTFRKKHIPADVLYLDIDYQDRNRPFTVDRKQFPAFERMITALGDAYRFRVVAITDLHIARAPDQGYRPYDEGTARDLFVHRADGGVYVGKVWPGDSVFPDFTWAPARKWWGGLYKDFVVMGIDGFWNDMNEPAIFDVPSKTMPLDNVHRSDSGAALTHREVHNVYGMQNTRATYEGLRTMLPKQRPFVLTRATYAGGQRYAASWTGDNSASWSHYRLTIPTLVNLGLSGMPFVGNDIGGYKGSPSPELFTRWMQLGAFTPLFRAHAEKGSADQEPWSHGKKHEVIRRQAIERRYRLLPYIYTAVEDMSRTGAPLMRPVWFERPELEGFYASSSVFLFGPDLLVAPKLDDDPTPMVVDVPPGLWFDEATGERIEGPQQRKLSPKLDEVPVFVRGGAIIPRQPLVQSTAEVPQGPLELSVYPGNDCRGSLYLDDGTSFAFRDGAMLRLQFRCAVRDDGLTVSVSAAEGRYVPWFAQVRFVVHGVVQKPRHVAVGGRETKRFDYDRKLQQLTVTAPYASTGVELVLR